MNKDYNVIRLEKRVSHLERKLVVWASRMKKEVIWRKFLEDWLLTKFNFDLRLQTELKTLEQDGVDEFERQEGPVSAPPAPQQNYNNAPSAATTSIRHRMNNSRGRHRPFMAAGRSSYYNTNQLNTSVPSTSKVMVAPTNTTANLTRDISITVVNGNNANAQNQNSGSNSQVISGGGGALSIPSTKSIINQTILQQQLAYGPGRNPRMTNPNITQGTPMKRPTNQSTNVTSSVHHGSPNSKRIRLRGPPNSQTSSVISPTHPIIVSTTSMASNQSQGGPTGNNSPVKSPELILLDDEDDQVGKTGRSETISSQPQIQQPTPSTSAGANIAPMTSYSDGSSATAQISDGLSMSTASNSNAAIANYAYKDTVLSNNAISAGPEATDSVVQYSNSQSESADSTNAEFYGNILQYETIYTAGGFMRRYGESREKIAFDVRKVLQMQDSFISDSVLHDILESRNMSAIAKKNVTYAVCDFLIRVYGENPPRVAKESMAESLYSFFPFVAKESWWMKALNKNPSGSLEHRINNKRRQVYDDRRRQSEATQSTAQGNILQNHLEGSIGFQNISDYITP